MTLPLLDLDAHRVHLLLQLFGDWAEQLAQTVAEILPGQRLQCLDAVGFATHRGVPADFEPSLPMVSLIRLATANILREGKAIHGIVSSLYVDKALAKSQMNDQQRHQTCANRNPGILWLPEAHHALDC